MYLVGYIEGWNENLNPLIKGIYTDFTKSINVASKIQFVDNVNGTFIVFIAEIEPDREYNPMSMFKLYDTFDTFYILRPVKVETDFASYEDTDTFQVISNFGIKICEVSKNKIIAPAETPMQQKETTSAGCCHPAQLGTVVEPPSEVRFREPEPPQAVKVLPAPEHCTSGPEPAPPVPEIKEPSPTVPLPIIHATPAKKPREWKRLDQQVAAETWDHLRKKITSRN